MVYNFLHHGKLWRVRGFINSPQILLLHPTNYNFYPIVMMFIYRITLLSSTLYHTPYSNAYRIQLGSLRGDAAEPAGHPGYDRDRHQCHCRRFNRHCRRRCRTLGKASDRAGPVLTHRGAHRLRHVQCLTTEVLLLLVGAGGQGER